VINEAEAATVRMIFERFVEIGSRLACAKTLAAEGVRNKRGKRSTRASSTSSSTTGSISAKPSTRARPIPASTRPSSSRTSGTRSRASCREPAHAGEEYPLPDTGAAEGDHLHRDGHGDDADGARRRHAALPLLRLDGPDQTADRSDSPSIRCVARRDGRGCRRRRGPANDPRARDRGSHDQDAIRHESPDEATNERSSRPLAASTSSGRRCFRPSRPASSSFWSSGSPSVRTALPSICVRRV
jgi:hypothetical protein